VKKENAMKQTTLYAVIALVIGAGVGFFGGVKYQQSKIPSFSGNFRDGMVRNGRQGTPNGQSGSRFGGGRVVGEVLSIDDSSLTVKLGDGSSKIVLLASDTAYTKSESGSKNDIKTGTRVGVFGLSNSDGSITAQDIQINPVFRMPSGVLQKP
jgi:hypothetical protein